MARTPRKRGLREFRVQPTELWEIPHGLSSGDRSPPEAFAATAFAEAEPGREADDTPSAGGVARAQIGASCQAQSGGTPAPSRNFGDSGSIGAHSDSTAQTQRPSCGAHSARSGMGECACATVTLTGPDPGASAPGECDAGADPLPGIAAAGSGRTDSQVHTYDNHHRSSHKLAAMGVRRPVGSVAPDSLPQAPGASASGAGSTVAVAFKPTCLPALDGVGRVAAFAAADAQHRIGVGKVTGPLGWEAGTALVATCDMGRVTVCAGVRESVGQAPVTLDGKGRLRLGPAAAAVLRLEAGSQVLAVAVPVVGQLVLMSAAAALVALTGELAVDSPEVVRPDQADESPKPAARTDVRGRFIPAQAVA